MTEDSKFILPVYRVTCWLSAYVCTAPETSLNKLLLYEILRLPSFPVLAHFEGFVRVGSQITCDCL